MANKNLTTRKSNYLFFFIFITILLLSCKDVTAKEEIINKEQYLTNLNNVNITKEYAQDPKKLKELIAKNKGIKALYLEHWILYETKNIKTLKKLHKIAKKNDIRFYLVTGKNSWFGKRGLKNTMEVYDTYGKYVDGIVLRVEPNKINVWKKDDIATHAQILNEMLDAYSAIYSEAKQRNKKFIAEFPFWLSDYEGPLKTFSQNVCEYTDKIIFLIDNTEKLDSLNIRWNDVPCSYNINLTKKALQQTEDGIKNIYQKLKAKLSLYQNFQGYIIDPDTTLNEQNP